MELERKSTRDMTPLEEVIFTRAREKDSLTEVDTSALMVHAAQTNHTID